MPDPNNSISIGPSGWPEREREIYFNIQRDPLPGNPTAIGQNGAVTTALNGLAARVGIEVLKQGGSSADAAIATVLAQIVLGGGAVISFFGVGAILQYSAESESYTSINASWNTCLNENDPLSIPGSLNVGEKSLEDMLGTEPSGRTALVGGLMKGLERLHQRDGKMPFSRLFEAAIELAEFGFPMYPGLKAYLELRVEDLCRLEETKATLLKPDGSIPELGESFRQPALARTLRSLAERGSDYMYKGRWAERAVQAVQNDGGKMTLEDLSRYDVIVEEAVQVEFDDYTAYFPNQPCTGTAALVESLNLARAADIKTSGHWTESPTSLRKLAMCCGAAGGMRYESQEQMEHTWHGFDMSWANRLSTEHAESMWARLSSDESPLSISETKTHSDDVVAVDQWGNMTTICHSINCMIWGKTAIVVDGVSIGDPGSYMQNQIAKTKPGNQLENPIEIGILSKGGKPTLAWSSMGVGLHYQSTQTLLNIIEFGKDIEDAVNTPGLLLPLNDAKDPMKIKLRVIEGTFEQKLLDASELDVELVPTDKVRFVQGLFVGIARDPKTGMLTAISPPYTNGWSLAL